LFNVDSESNQQERRGDEDDARVSAPPFGWLKHLRPEGDAEPESHEKSSDVACVVDAGDRGAQKQIDRSHPE